jgi:hypothetical protein
MGAKLMNGVGVGTERDDKHKAFSGALTVLFDLVPTSLISHLLFIYTADMWQCGNAK